MTKVTVAFRSFANAQEKGWGKIYQICTTLYTSTKCV
jgi:hypothetical protein